MLKIYGSPLSSAGRCFWCLEEIGVSYESQTLNFKDKEHLSAEFLKLNPSGKVPVLIDDDFALCESMAINFYLAEKYKTELLGDNLKEKAKTKQWSFWAIADLQTPLIQVFIQKFFVPKERIDKTIIKKNLKKLPRLLEVLNNELEKQDFLVHNKFTLADINVYSVLVICDSIEHEYTEYPNIVNWVKNIKNQNSYKKYSRIIEDCNNQASKN